VTGKPEPVFSPSLRSVFSEAAFQVRPPSLQSIDDCLFCISMVVIMVVVSTRSPGPQRRILASKLAPERPRPSITEVSPFSPKSRRNVHCGDGPNAASRRPPGLRDYRRPRARTQPSDAADWGPG
jgi:hypothetical protein